MSKEKPVSTTLDGLYANPTEMQKQEIEAKKKREEVLEIDGLLETEEQASEAPNLPLQPLYQGEYDGLIKINFRAGNGYKYSFAFALPNVLGTLGVATLNNESVMTMIEKALIYKLGSGGVVRIVEG